MAIKTKIRSCDDLVVGIIGLPDCFVDYILPLDAILSKPYVDQKKQKKALILYGLSEW